MADNYNNKTSSLSFYDLFLNLPHPAASKTCLPYEIITPGKNTANVTATTNEVIKEFSDVRSIARITRFVFPEFNDRDAKATNPDALLNKYDIYFTQFALSKSQQHIFSLQLSSGVRIKGYVLRYLPVHSSAKNRYDVGRRGVRALVLLTHSNYYGDCIYMSALRTLEAKISLMSVSNESSMINAHLESYLNQIALVSQGDCKIKELEFSNELFSSVDIHSLGNPKQRSSVAILPLVRVLGQNNTLRVLSALLCERRIVVSSKSLEKLSVCVNALPFILELGLLYWQHVFIPILPPHLYTYLSTPVPYIIGVLGKFGEVDGMGELLHVDLDENMLHVYNCGRDVAVGTWVPDLLRGSMVDDDNRRNIPSLPEVLAQEISEILKQDKKVNASEVPLMATVAKNAQLVQRAISKMRFRMQTSLEAEATSNQNSTAVESETAWVEEDVTEFGPYELGEFELRISFTTFFCSLIGDIGWYLSKDPQSNQPIFDKTKYVNERKKLGDVQGTPMFPLVSFLVKTQLMEEFVQSRIQEIIRKKLEDKWSLFSATVQYHRTKRIDFNMLNIRRSARLVASREREEVSKCDNIRQTALALTSNTRYEGDPMKVLADLTQKSREVNTVLVEVMTVIWYRIRDSKGAQWRHAVQSLVMLRNLLLHGPITTISEASAGIDKIRALKNYNPGNRNPQTIQIRNLATQVVDLLVDKAKLIHQRRYCADRRRRKNSLKLSRASKLTLRLGFKAIHYQLKPNISYENARVGDLLFADPYEDNGAFSTTSVKNQRTNSVRASSTSYAKDLLNFDYQDPSAAHMTNSEQHPTTPFDQITDGRQNPQNQPNALDLLDFARNSASASTTNISTTVVHDPFSSAAPMVSNHTSRSVSSNSLVTSARPSPPTSSHGTSQFDPSCLASAMTAAANTHDPFSCAPSSSVQNQVPQCGSPVSHAESNSYYSGQYTSSSNNNMYTQSKSAGNDASSAHQNQNNSYPYNDSTSQQAVHSFSQASTHVSTGSQQQSYSYSPGQQYSTQNTTSYYPSSSTNNYAQYTAQTSHSYNNDGYNTSSTQQHHTASHQQQQYQQQHQQHYQQQQHQQHYQQQQQQHQQHYQQQQHQQQYQQNHQQPRRTITDFDPMARK